MLPITSLPETSLAPCPTRKLYLRCDESWEQTLRREVLADGVIDHLLELEPQLMSLM